MRRREFVAGLGIAATLPRVTNAQQSSVPVIGYQTPSDQAYVRNIAGYRRGLADLGLVEGRDYRFQAKYTDFQIDRYPILFREWLEQKPAVVIVASTAGLLLAKPILQSIPVVFTIGTDPVENGAVESLNKPGGNITGIFTLMTSVSGKRVHLLHELLPTVATFAFLRNPDSPKVSEVETHEIRAAAEAAGLNLVVVNARNPDEFEPAFQAAIREGAGGLIVGLEGLFTGQAGKLVTLAASYRIPTIYADNLHVREGGLISYGADQDDSFRLVGTYAGRILKGEKPQNMPVQRSTTTKLAINLKTAKDLGITVPPMLLSRADEVIE